MLTAHDVRLQADTGMVPPDRMRALVFALTAQADDARAAASVLPADSQAAAALRGKAHAYRDAAGMVGRIGAGHSLRPRAYSSARRAASEWGRRRTERAAARRREDGGA